MEQSTFITEHMKEVSTVLFDLMVKHHIIEHSSTWGELGEGQKDLYLNFASDFMDHYDLEEIPH